MSEFVVVFRHDGTTEHIQTHKVMISNKESFRQRTA